MKLPDITQQPVGEYALGNISQPNYRRLGKEIQGLIYAGGRLTNEIYNRKLVGDIDEATGQAAEEITELRAKLVNQNMIPLNEVPDDIETEFEVNVSDGKGGREAVDIPMVFTHDVSDRMWQQGTEEIINHYADQISSPEARGKFLEEMSKRYVVPGTLAVTAANVNRGKAYAQARAERAIEGILSSDAPTETREEQIKEIIARQSILGADPQWVEKQLSELGPKIDQLDVHNAIIGAQTIDEVDQIEEDMWSGGSRMSPEQMRTMSSQMDARRRDYLTERKEKQTETADQMFGTFVDGDLTNENVANAVTGDRITREAAWTFFNAINSGTTVKASNPMTLSQYRGEIFKLQYTGNNARVTDKAKLLKLMVSRGVMGLNPQGVPTGVPATISGEDAFKLNKDIDAAVKLALENEEYKNALDMVRMWTRTKLDIEGQFTTAFGGNQNQVEAAVAFKRSLDTYMDQYGIDAKPVDFFETNKEAYDPRRFSEGINARFIMEFPQATSFMTIAPDGEGYEFSDANQENFVLWISDNIASIGEEEAERAMSLFNQYYRGQGIPPDDGRLMLEPDDPLYRQFQSTIQDNE